MDLRPHLLEALSLVLPSSCAGCGVNDRLVCESCRLMLKPEIRTAELWHEGEPGLPLVYGLDYAAPVSGILHAFKENGATAAARPLGRSLRTVVRSAVPLLSAHVRGFTAGEQIHVTSPPSSRTNFLVRGYDPVRLLLRHAQLVHHPSLRRATGHRDRADQTRLARLERFNNLAGSLQALPQVRGHSFLLVDDVATSGATLLECARALRGAGATVVGAVTLAYTPRKFLSDSQQK